MRTPRIFVCFFKAPVFCFLCITKCMVDCNRLSGPDVVNGTYGGSVTVLCQYALRYKEYTKYWCKGPVYEMCDIVVKTPKNRHNDRSFISDDKTAGIFTVTMTSLSESDTDKYWCVISRPGRNIYAGVRLLVSHEGKDQPDEIHNNIIVLGASTSTTPVNSTHPQQFVRWWAILRWIIFLLMLCCLASTYYVVWRIRNGKEILLRRPIHQRRSTVKK